MSTFKLAFVGLLALVIIGTFVQAEEKGHNPCGEKAMMPQNPCGAKSGMTFYINDPMMRNSITFKSEAPLEDIIGTSSQVTGYIHFDPENPKIGGHGELTVPVASLNTGIPMRDEHLRGADWLNTEMYPDVILHIKEVKNIKHVKFTDNAQTYDITVIGDLSIHGHTGEMEISGRMSYLSETDMTRQKMPGNLLAVRAEFGIPLKDFGVTGPAGMGIIGSKVSQTIDVEVSFMGSTHSSAMASGADNPCGGKAMNPCNPCGGKMKMDAGNPCATKTDEVGNPCAGKEKSM